MGPARPGAGRRIAQQVRQPPPAFPRRCLCRPSRARHTPRGLPSHPLMPTCAPPCPRAVGRQGARDEAGSARAGARREASQRAHRRRGGRHAGAFAKPGRSAAVLAHTYRVYLYTSPTRRRPSRRVLSTTRARGRHGRGADAARAARTSRCLPPCCQSAAPRRSCAKPWHYIIGGII